MGCRLPLPCFLGRFAKALSARGPYRGIGPADKRPWRLLLTLLLSAATASAASLRQMDLKGLIQNSDQIFRATVVSATRGSVQIGGGTIPTLTYELQIVDSFKGQSGGVTRITTVTSPAEDSGTGLKRFPLFRDVPQLGVGRDYVLFVTRPSSLGLSTTVGLRQGCFDVLLQNNKEVAVNGFNNAGLGLGSPAGPVGYEELSAAIHSYEPK